MHRGHACNAQEMGKYLEEKCQEVVQASTAHHGQIFRQQVFTVLSHMPRIGKANSRDGVLSMESVKEIENVMQRCLTQLDVEVSI